MWYTPNESDMLPPQPPFQVYQPSRDIKKAWWWCDDAWRWWGWWRRKGTRQVGGDDFNSMWHQILIDYGSHQPPRCPTAKHTPISENTMQQVFGIKTRTKYCDQYLLDLLGLGHEALMNKSWRRAVPDGRRFWWLYHQFRCREFSGINNGTCIEYVSRCGPCAWLAVCWCWLWCVLGPSQLVVVTINY